MTPSSTSQALSYCERVWLSQCEDVIAYCIINIIYILWFCKNKSSFNERIILTEFIVNTISPHVCQTHNHTNSDASSSVKKFKILKYVMINFHPPNTHIIMEFLWYAPKACPVKCNINGVTLGSTCLTVCGCIFRNNFPSTFGRFSQNICINTIYIFNLLV